MRRKLYYTTKEKTIKNFENFDLPLAPNNLPFTVTLDHWLARVYNEPVRFKRERGKDMMVFEVKANVRKRLAASWLQYMTAIQEGRKSDATWWRGMLGYDRMTLQMLNGVNGDTEI